MLLPSSFSARSRVPVAPSVLQGLRVSLAGFNRVRVEPGIAVLSNADFSFVITASLEKEIIKNVLSLWQPGHEQGGRDSGAIAENGDWYVYLIYNTEKQKADVLLSQEKTVPLLPSGYNFFAKLELLWRTQQIFEIPEKLAMENAVVRGEWSTPINQQVYNGIMPPASSPLADRTYHIFPPDQVRRGDSYGLHFGNHTTPGVNYGNWNFAGAAFVVAAGGHNAFLIPHNSTVSHAVFIGSNHDVDATFPGNGAYLRGVTMRDGRVFLIPYNATQARIYNPLTNTVEVVTGHTFPGNGAYNSGTLLRDGRVFLCPHNATAIRIFNPETNQVQVLSHSLPGGLAFRGCHLLRSGHVFMVPFNSTSARIYDPVADTLTAVGSFPGNGAYAEAIPTYTASTPSTDGSFDAFVLVPHNSTSAQGIRIAIAQHHPPNFTQLFSLPGTYPGSGGYLGGALIRDGKVFLCPYNASSGVVIDFEENTAVSFGNQTGSEKYYGCLYFPNGWLHTIPANRTGFGLLIPARAKYTFPLRFCRSPLLTGHA